MKKSLMEIIDEKRNAEQMRVSELCSMIGVDESTYAMWRDDPDSINLTTLRKIADILCFSDDEMKSIVN